MSRSHRAAAAVAQHRAMARAEPTCAAHPHTCGEAKPGPLEQLILPEEHREPGQMGMLPGSSVTLGRCRGQGDKPGSGLLWFAVLDPSQSLFKFMGWCL